jgi:hypothetical protein
MAMAIAESRVPVFCALETYLYPHAVLLKGGATRLRAPVRFRFGGGAAHGHHRELLPSGAEREQASNQTHRVGAQVLCAHERSSTQAVHHGRARLPGSPIVTQFGRRLAYSPPLTLEKGVEIEHHVSFQHVIDGSGQLMR